MVDMESIFIHMYIINHKQQKQKLIKEMLAYSRRHKKEHVFKCTAMPLLPFPENPVKLFQKLREILQIT